MIKKTRDKLYLKYKGSGNSFNSFIDRKGIAMQNSYYQEPDKHSKKKIKIELDLCNYEKKLKQKSNKCHVLDFTKTTDLPNLKSYVDKLDIYEWKTVLTDLRKLGNI